MFKKGEKIRIIKAREDMFLRKQNGFLCCFKGGITDEMVRIYKRNNGVLTISEVRGDRLKVIEDNGVFTWDAEWFEVLSECKMKKLNLKVGDIIKIIDAGIGAHGCNGAIGIVTSEENKHGLSRFSATGINVEITESKFDFMIGQIWKIADDALVEVIRSNNKKTVEEIVIIKKGNETIAIIEDKVGKTKKSPSDTNDDSIGIIVATMRALKFDKLKVDKVVDVLFGSDEKVETLEEVSMKKLIKELQNRVL